jgi:hypothetical protein
MPKIQIFLRINSPENSAIINTKNCPGSTSKNIPENRSKNSFAEFFSPIRAGINGKIIPKLAISNKAVRSAGISNR